MNTSVAIACQGGGSHTAFTAGVLSVLASHWPASHQLVGISGTSGGALCAGLFWESWVRGPIAAAEERLRAFWAANSASSPLDAWINAWMMSALSLRGVIPHLELSPYDLPNWGQENFAGLLDAHFDLGAVQARQRPEDPALLLGAVDVQCGSFHIFHSRKCRLQNSMLLASAAIPNFFRAVEVEGRFYWDGLFSHNPPLLSLLEEKPAEIWVIQINPPQRCSLPRSVEEIEDRRNELAGNLSLEQEVESIELINRLIASGHLQHPRCRPVTLRRIQLQLDLPYASKLDRSPSFLARLFAHGIDAAKDFVSELSGPVEQPEGALAT